MAISAGRVSLLLHAAGLIFVYSSYGVLQVGAVFKMYLANPKRPAAEAVTRRRLRQELRLGMGPNGERFTSSSLLIVANRVISVSVGLSILFFKSRQTPEAGSFSARLRPASSMVAYTSVAVFNFLSTTSQYEALKYVSYTTQSLAKTSKMIPVLVVGAVVWKKQHKRREWVAGAVILMGCATYLFSQPPNPKHLSTSTDQHSAWNGFIGALFLTAYLFFDGMVSTTQEKVFGRNPSSDPFGAESPVLDQMVSSDPSARKRSLTVVADCAFACSKIWTNVFAGGIALLVALLSSTTGSLLPNLVLLMTSPALVWDILTFSAASAIGLIILLNTIASFGALTSSLIMTIRQFLSILINAGLFGNFGAVSIEGWCGVGWVASGIWIKINKSFDPPKQEKALPKVVVFSEDSDEESDNLIHEKEALKDDVEEPLHNFQKKSPSLIKIFTLQYLIPVLVPLALAIVIAPFALSSGSLQSSGALSKTQEWPTKWVEHAPTWLKGSTAQDSTASSATDKYDPSAAESFAEAEAEAQIEQEEAQSTDSEADGAYLPSQETTDLVDDTAADDSPDASAPAEEVADNTENAHEEEMLAEVNAAESAEMIELQGGRWAHQLHDAVKPKCGHIDTIPYSTQTRTGFVSFPRSGNSFMRSLVERATGYQTSSVYCDQKLSQTFTGECDHNTNFFVKTHFPALPKGAIQNNLDYFKTFDQTFLLVRNPIDAMASWWQLQQSGRTPEGYLQHNAKTAIEGGKFGELHRKRLLDMAQRWADHSMYWLDVPILTHTMRYEDLKASPIPHMMGLLAFLLPEEDLPSLESLACMVEHDESHEAYHSRRASEFAAWDMFEPELRMDILLTVKRPFCMFGYEKVLERAKGALPEMAGFCADIVVDRASQQSKRTSLRSRRARS
ncbi:BZ3500_MvSof-1268-A1-R1_Chr3-2g06323 [Microbotryum saponariae]|uniref:BZ3500_MvSof-1268-A1-R1_Chr3-2g06323 protein n=1 Tax=Microbotryum saponariae TaxID=289078 RepID=A0A2X0KZ50_9BASI|nr:BZ3500_MvSof-1268-A1-R1_Chr3-2g06323 [Microbotryum saponariae]SDA04294.1 BZ3501_MvSof-1269-A2-R1_Chr3-2g06014 [Microbotryum saponariae]